MEDREDNPRQIAVVALPDDIQQALSGDRMSNDQMAKLLEMTGMAKTADEIRTIPDSEPPEPNWLRRLWRRWF